MARIKVTGFINLDGVDDPFDFDPSHPTGLSERGYDKLNAGELITIRDLEDLETVME